jgi:hypothetical protein
MTEQGLTWWRGELNKDGGISTLTEVGQASKGSKLVCYVQATTRAEACSKIKAWWERRKGLIRSSSLRVRERRIAAGLCPTCGKAPCAPDRALCGPCLQAAVVRAEKVRRRKKGEHIPHAPGWRRFSSAEEAAEAASARRRAQRDKHGHVNVFAPTVLKKFDELGPVKFREWLVGIIESAKIREAVPEAEAAE